MVDSILELAAVRVNDRHDIEARIRCASLEVAFLVDLVAGRRWQKLAHTRPVHLLLGCRGRDLSVNHVLCADHGRLYLDHSLVLEDVLAGVVGEHFGFIVVREDG